VTTVVLDSGVIIGVLDSADTHHQASVMALAGVHRHELVVPASVLAEVLVRPYSRDPKVVQTVERFLVDLGARVHPLDEAVAHAAARLCASHVSVRLPDALTVGTASVVGGTVLTTDEGWPQQLGVPVRLVTR
jgi:predicted nucleic acid-binding protein